MTIYISIDKKNNRKILHIFLNIVYIKNAYTVQTNFFYKFIYHIHINIIYIILYVYLYNII